MTPRVKRHGRTRLIWARPICARLGQGSMAAVLASLPYAAQAAVIGGGGGGMPYSAGIGKFSQSTQTEVAGFLIVIAVVCGVGGYIMGGQLEGMMQTVGKVIIGVGVIGGVAAIATLAGVTGAVI